MMQLIKLCIIVCVYSACVTAEEVCVHEAFNASCAADQVVFIETAFYGRRNNSRCVSVTDNETACVVDLRLDIQKEFMSKPNNCFFKLAHEFFTIRNPCVNGPPPFLDITHRCTERNAKDICVWETFNAECSPGNVILIKSARYGRMRSSRCIAYENTGLNCYTNVGMYFEKQCNGRSQCRVLTTDPQLTQEETSCNIHHTPYLEVDYTCVHDIRCAKFNTPENVAVEDIVDGYRLSCTDDRSISWEVRCVNETWISSTLRSCSASNLTKPEGNGTDIRCAKFNPPENVAVEDIVNGYRLSCTDDRNISWEVHCVNETWISSNLRSCSASNLTKPEVEMPFATQGNETDKQRFIMKIAISVPCATSGLIIFLIVVVVHVYTHKHRQQNQPRNSSSSYVDIDEIQSMKCTRNQESAPPVAPKPRPKTPKLVEPSPEPVPPGIYQKCRLPPDPSIYTELLHPGDTGDQPTAGAIINVPLNLGNFKVTLSNNLLPSTKKQNPSNF